MTRVLLLLLFACGWLAAQGSPSVITKTPPKVVAMTPDNHATAVDPSVTELVVEFDQDMDRGGHSICGGGVTFPKFMTRPRWDGHRKLVMTVMLKPDQDYELSLNCKSVRTIRSKIGVLLPLTKWRFTTLPKNPRPVAEQRQRNEAALARLVTLLDESYSYRDRKVKDWGALRKQHREVLLGARTDRAFAVAATKMLAAAEDLHLSLGYAGKVYATWKPVIEPLYRTFAVRRLFKLGKVSGRAFQSRTDDGIGYFLITEWHEAIDPERLIGAIAEMMDAKALIIDVRPCRGGDEQIARRIASWFVEGTHVYARDRTRIGPGKDGFSEVHDRKITGHDAAFDRPVAVLSGPRVMSVNESFVLMMKQARDAIIVGQATYGASGKPKEYALGNDVTITLPSRQELLPDGTCFEGKGIEPDVFVPCTSRDFKTRDPSLDKALQLLRARIATGK